MSTIIDVAKHAGVSPMTVSRFLNKPELVRPATRTRVAAAIDLLRFVPNESARALIRRRTNTVALVLADITNPYFTTIARGVEDAAAGLGLTTILGNTDERLEKQARYVETLVARRVDGVILSPILGSEPHLELLTARGIPVLLIDRRVEGSTADVLLSDSRAGGRQLAEHLVARGHTDVLFVGGPAGVSSLEERLAGVRAGLAAHGLAPEVHLGRYDQRSGEELVDALVQRGRLPPARAGAGPRPVLIAANNLVALGALAALRRQRRRVPQDVALAGFGDLEQAALVDPFLTVVAHPAYAMGRTAMEMLAHRLDGYTGAPRERVLPVQLVVRRSA